MRQFREHTYSIVSAWAYFLGEGYLIRPREIKPGQFEGHFRTGAGTFLFRAIRPSISLSEAEYNDNCQDKCSS